MIAEHLLTLEAENDQSASAYLLDNERLSFWAKIGVAVFEIGSAEDLDDFVDLLKEIQTQVNKELNMNSEDAFIEDAFIADEEGWIHLPGRAGVVSPDGVVYDEDGKEMYSLHNDEEVPNRYAVTYSEDEIDWI